MKVLLSILLGMMLLTSLVGISYATPVQPLDNNNNNCVPNQNNPNYTFGNCGANTGGTPRDPNPPSNCGDGSSPKSPDTCLCSGGISPHGSEISATCCGTGITPQSAQVSDIGPDCLK